MGLPVNRGWQGPGWELWQGIRGAELSLHVPLNVLGPEGWDPLPRARRLLVWLSSSRPPLSKPELSLEVSQLSHAGRWEHWLAVNEATKDSGWSCWSKGSARGSSMASPTPFSISPFSAAFPQGKCWVCCPPQAVEKGSCLHFAQRPMGKAQALTRSCSAWGSRLHPLAGVGTMLAPAAPAACTACPQPFLSPHRYVTGLPLWPAAGKKP